MSDLVTWVTLVVFYYKNLQTSRSTTFWKRENPLYHSTTDFLQLYLSSYFTSRSIN